MATDYTATQTGGAWNANIVPIQNRVTIAAGATGTYHQVLDVLKGDTILAFSWKLIQGHNKVSTIQFGLEGGDTDGFCADTVCGTTGTNGTITIGAGALLQTVSAIMTADDTIDALITVAAGPATTDLVFDVQAVVLRNPLA